MTFKLSDNRIGDTGITDVTSILPGNSNLPGVVLDPQLGAIRRGTDPGLGEGEFIYLKGVASLTVGDLVTYNALTGAVTRWDGTANTGFPLAVAMSAPSATQCGWFQISGNAIANCSGTVAAGDKVFWQAVATVSSTAVAGKQVLGAQAASANNATINGAAIGAAKAVYTINRPFVQGQIT